MHVLSIGKNSGNTPGLFSTLSLHTTQKHPQIRKRKSWMVGFKDSNSCILVHIVEVTSKGIMIKVKYFVIKIPQIYKIKRNFHYGYVDNTTMLIRFLENHNIVVTTKGWWKDGKLVAILTLIELFYLSYRLNFINFYINEIKYHLINFHLLPFRLHIK